ncbi:MULTISPECIES: PQQ-dependent dehydrogenase, methanol/ethanol family [unclassified Mesorhizobium]|uniref:PQQ-dependent dehydrogenase, methanol/ethanol family n=1 Tax=unclassified Mesorhizobium TaxID=325217 RepID=UPI0013ED1916|nr:MULTISPECIES: PQQ-dependent dehydrogenase, methanol/ethanol family [unclassified Mesorhizobium]
MSDILDANAQGASSSLKWYNAMGAATNRKLYLARPLFILLLAAIVFGIILYDKLREGEVSSTKLWHSLTWRLELYGRKAVGGVPDLSWGELFQMTKPSSGFVLTTTVTEARSLDAAVSNPYVSSADLSAGAEIFRRNCTACHDGSGAHAPLLDRPLRHGDSDLAIYKVVRDGIPQSAMASHADLSFDNRWRVVGYIRSLQAKTSAKSDDSARRLDIRVKGDDLLAPNSVQWLTYSGSLDGHRYSPLAEITKENVSRLHVRWVGQFDTNDRVMEATPLVVGGTLFTSVPPASIVAFDTKSGSVIWKFDRPIPDNLPMCCGRVNRGLAVLGNTLFIGTLDGVLVAVDANTGKEVWETMVAKPSEGFTMTGAPLVVNKAVIVGVAGGEFGIRGFLAAYDPETGKEKWKFNTIPGPGEPGHETWKNDAWRTGGGPTWVTGSYDPSLDLLYWGVGNPSPNYNHDVRPGDNLFTNSVIALRASTGKLEWHFQFTPHDEHDWDSNQTPILAELTINGVKRKVICWANRNGFYYVLDRATGEFLTGVNFVEQNWTDGLDRAGRPIVPEGASTSGRLIKPGSGGTNWPNPAFDQSQSLFFVPATESASIFTKSDDGVERGEGGLFVGSGAATVAPPMRFVRALDAATGKKRWEFHSPYAQDSGYGGLLATAGGLVFGASAGVLFALDSATGREVWRMSIDGDTRAAPISFVADGHQEIAIASGRALFVFGL